MTGLQGTMGEVRTKGDVRMALSSLSIGDDMLSETKEELVRMMGEALFEDWCRCELIMNYPSTVYELMTNFLGNLLHACNV